MKEERKEGRKEGRKEAKREAGCCFSFVERLPLIFYDVIEFVAGFMSHFVV